jgi:hypothetical protein
MSEQDYLFLSAVETAIEFADSLEEYEALISIKEDYYVLNSIEA